MPRNPRASLQRRLARLPDERLTKAVASMARREPVLSASLFSTFPFVSERIGKTGMNPMDLVPYLVALSGTRAELWHWSPEDLPEKEFLASQTFEPEHGHEHRIDLEWAFLNGLPSNVSTRGQKLLWSALKVMALRPAYHSRPQRDMVVLSVLLKVAIRDQKKDVLLWGLAYLSEHRDQVSVRECLTKVARKIRFLKDRSVRQAVQLLLDRT